MHATYRRTSTSHKKSIPIIPGNPNGVVQLWYNKIIYWHVAAGYSRESSKLLVGDQVVQYQCDYLVG
jgi:hypothetical protein